MKELPTFKDVDFRNNMQKVYVTEEEKEKILEKLNRDVEVQEFKPESIAWRRISDVLESIEMRILIAQ